MRPALLLSALLLMLLVPISCGAPSQGTGELETKVAELETQLSQAQTAPPSAASPSETATAPPSPQATDTPAVMPTATHTPVPVDTPTPVPPTPTSPPPPSPTPTQPVVGTRANPVPRGQSRQAPDGWQITVVDFNPQAWPVVQAENQFNDPPAPGNRMVMVRVAVTNAGAEDDPAWISDAEFYLVGSKNVLYSTFGEQSSCGVIPDELADKLFRGGTADGNVCFQIPADEADLRLLYEYAWDEYLFFAVE